jgi:hypothetical protein
MHLKQQIECFGGSLIQFDKNFDVLSSFVC